MGTTAMTPHIVVVAPAAVRGYFVHTVHHGGAQFQIRFQPAGPSDLDMTSALHGTLVIRALDQHGMETNRYADLYPVYGTSNVTGGPSFTMAVVADILLRQVTRSFPPNTRWTPPPPPRRPETSWSHRWANSRTGVAVCVLGEVSSSWTEFTWGDQAIYLAKFESLQGWIQEVTPGRVIFIVPKTSVDLLPAWCGATGTVFGASTFKDLLATIKQVVEETFELS